MSMKEKISFYLSKRMLIVLVMGFASGLPLGLTGSALQAWYTVDGVDIVTIGFLGLVGQPYVYKFLWSPFMDRLSPFGRRRKGWIIITQVALIATLFLMACFTPSQMPIVLGIAALCFAFLSASQDIAIDAYRTEILKPHELGGGAAMFVGGYRVAMLVSGGLALVIANYVGFQVTYMLMAIFVGLCLLVTLTAKEPKAYSEPPPNMLHACIDPLKEFLSRPSALALLALIILYKLGDAFAGNLTTAFLLRGVGFDLIDVGLINKTVGLAATLIGVFAGGFLMAKIGLFRSLLWFGIIQAVTNLAYLLLTLVGTDYTLMCISIFLENLGGGLGTAAFLAFIMSLCNPKYTATQFALLSALSAIGRVFVGPAAGILVDKVGWTEFFVWTLLISIPGIVLLIALKGVINRNEAATKAQKQVLTDEDSTSESLEPTPVGRGS